MEAKIASKIKRKASIDFFIPISNFFLTLDLYVVKMKKKKLNNPKEPSISDKSTPVSKAINLDISPNNKAVFKKM